MQISIDENRVKAINKYNVEEVTDDLGNSIYYVYTSHGILIHVLVLRNNDVYFVDQKYIDEYRTFLDRVHEVASTKSL
jgi:hypothetical protein